MDRALVKSSRVKPPAALAKLFADPPLVGNETREDYDGLFNAIAAAAKPADAIAWLFVRDITDLSWEIRRERSLKLQVIKSAQTGVVRELLTPPQPFTDKLILFDFEELDPNAEKIAKEMKQWASDPKARRRIEKELAEKGHDASEILTMALNQAADRIDAIDRRIATYELRRMAALRAIGHYGEMLARRLEAVSSEVIEEQFTEAAE
jgi:nucleotide-binding universal stress UspA family protein